METNYTLIHYLSEGSHYNSWYGNNSSICDIFFYSEEEDIIAQYAKLLVEKHFQKNVDGYHEYTILINGVDVYSNKQVERKPLFHKITQEAEDMAKTLIAEKQLEIDQAAKIQAEKVAKFKKSVDRHRIKSEIVRLQAELNRTI